MMEYEEFEEILIEKASKMNITWEEKQIKQLYQYMQLLLLWNEKMNLTAITDPKDIILKHFIDSFTIEPYLPKNVYLADIGTGAGFPGIPLKIIRPDITIVLVDALQKRIHFLQEVIQKLTLSKITTIHARIEEFARNTIYREQFDRVTARAVSNLSVLSEYMIPLLKISGKAIVMKGSNVEQEMQEAKKAIHLLGGKIEKVESFVLPNSDIGRNIIILNKEQKTPNQYPRKAGTPSRQPLG